MKLKFWPKTKPMRFSVIAFIVSLVLSILSMGFLGIGLYFIAAAPLALLFPNLPNNMDAWHGDWVWPALLGMPLLWSFGFLIAGWVYLQLEKLDWTVLTKKTSYIVTLLLWNILTWLMLLLNVTPEMT